MPPRFKKVIDPPVTSSTYTKLIKECCVQLPDVKEYVGKCIAEFRKEAEKRNEKKNFKFTVKSEKGEKLFCLKVTGGFRALTRTKYYVNHGGIYRYDWRSKVWKVIKIISIIVSAVATVVGAITGVSQPAIAGAIYGVCKGAKNVIKSIDNKSTKAIEYPDYNSNYKYEEDNVYDSESDSDYYDEFECSRFRYEDQAYEVKNRYQTEYIDCRYWCKYRYCLIKFSCCDDWCCCRYCHMDRINHKISTSQNFQVYCLRCSTVFTYWDGRSHCPGCYYEHIYSLNLKTIANRCQFIIDIRYIPKKNCCDSIICCYRCHNDAYDHKADYNLTYYCCVCSQETTIDTGYCNNCNSYLKTDRFNLEKIPLKCPYFKNFYYLIKFNCCQNVYCCSHCHNSCENHSARNSNDKVCISCSNTESNSLDNYTCSYCSRRLFSAQRG